MFEGNKQEKILTLLTCCFALFMAMLDNTVVNVALPTLSRELGAGVSGLQWIVDGYVLAYASLLLTGGIIGDRYGRKRIFLGGLTLFTLASLASGFSQTTGQLIAFRALQGVGGALLIPGTLSILTVTFPPTERAQAIGIWAGVSGIALAAGPTVGGWMVEHFGWQSIFFLNVPIGVLGFAAGTRTIRESRAERARRLDLAGLGLGTASLFGFTYGLIEANQKGWANPEIAGSLVAGAVLLVTFLVWERRTEHPMLPLSFFRIPAFSAGNLVAFAVSFGMFGTFFFVSLFFQIARGYTPLQAGVRFLPMTGMIIVTAPAAGRLAQRYGSRWPMTIGLGMAATGLLLQVFVDQSTPYGVMVPMLVIMGIGMGMTMTPMTAAVMNAVGPQRAGMGSAMTNTSREVGGVLGIAALGTLLTTVLSSKLGAALTPLGLPSPVLDGIVARAGHGNLGSAIPGLSPDQMDAVRDAFGSSFTSGFHAALVVAGAVLLVAALVANRFVPSGAPAHAEPQEPQVGALEPAPVPAH